MKESVLQTDCKDILSWLAQTFGYDWQAMDSIKLAHRLTNVDHKLRTAVCSVCGPTEIYIAPSRKYGAVRRSCMNRMRETYQDYQRRLRAKKGLPELVRKPRHSLSEIDTETLTAICSVCGDTAIGKRNDGYYYCDTKKKQDTAAYRRARGVPPRISNPSHHHLSQIDDENETAICSICGPVRIYRIHLGTRIARRCSIAQMKYQEQALRNNKQFIDEYKVRLGCQRCGYNTDPLRLEFHRLDLCNKGSRFPRSILQNRKRLLQELEKNNVYCVSCHSLVHNEPIPIK